MQFDAVMPAVVCVCLCCPTMTLFGCCAVFSYCVQHQSDGRPIIDRSADTCSHPTDRDIARPPDDGPTMPVGIDRARSRPRTRTRASIANHLIDSFASRSRPMRGVIGWHRFRPPLHTHTHNAPRLLMMAMLHGIARTEFARAEWCARNAARHETRKARDFRNLPRASAGARERASRARAFPAAGGKSSQRAR